MAGGDLIVSQVVQDGATTGNGTVASPKGFGAVSTLYITPTGTISGGKVKFETAAEADYAGTWALLGTEQTLVTDTAQVVSVVGAHKHLRARISTNLAGGGTVKCEILVASASLGDLE